MQEYNTSVPDVTLGDLERHKISMATTASTTFYQLGDLAEAQGALGPLHSHATEQQMRTGVEVVTDPGSYTSELGDEVCCVEDRLHLALPRLAGGGLSLALMRNFLFGGARLSRDIELLRALGFRVILHDDCGALKLVVPVVKEKLSRVDAESYRALEALGIKVPMNIRQRIATWALSLPVDYVDADKARTLVDRVDSVEGSHNAVFAVVGTLDGESFIGGPRLSRETDGLLAFVFSPWVARRSATRMTESEADAAAAEVLALVFTAQVLLTLGGRDLRVAVRG